MLQTLAREFGIAAQSRGLVVDWVDTAAVVVSDEALLRRILQNFLSNALRYSERGRVLLGCRRREGLLWIEVHDQGPGIPDALQGEIFEEFRRLHDGQQRGAGLGRRSSTASVGCSATRSACARSWARAACSRWACRSAKPARFPLLLLCRC